MGGILRSRNTDMQAAATGIQGTFRERYQISRHRVFYQP